MDPLSVSLLVFITFFVTYLILTKYQDRVNLRSRLKFTEKKHHMPQRNSESSKPDEEKQSFLKSMAETFRKRNKQTIDHFRITFERCGWDPYSAGLLVPFYKLLGIIVFCLLFFVVNALSGHFASLSLVYKYVILFLFLFIGYRSFDYYTDYKIRTRRDRITKDIPMAIDLLVVCVRAGLSFDRALDRISQEVIHTNPDLARELTITSAELGILPERKMAYKNFAKRVDAELIKILTTSLIQSEEQGVAVGKTLMYLSQESSKQKLMDIERQAAKLPSKLTVPVVLLSLPAILIIILGPSISAIFNSDLFGG